jgi:hypothetical protein
VDRINVAQDRDQVTLRPYEPESRNNSVRIVTVVWTTGVRIHIRAEIYLSEISGSHGGEYEGYCLLECCAV